MTAVSRSVDLDRRGRIAVITVNNPPVNALSQHVRQGLREGMRAAIADAAVGAIAIVCSGRTFIAGADITEFGKPPQEPSLHDVLDVIESSPKPVVAVVQGTALGGGLEVTLACHYRIGVKSARFGLPEVKLGLLPGAGGTQRLPRLVGLAKALDILLRGRTMGPEEALAIGLVDRVIPAENFLDEVMAFARQLAAGTGKALGFIKVAVTEGIELPLEQALAVERRYGLENLKTHDAKEGLTAFAEKRKPNFLSR